MIRFKIKNSSVFITENDVQISTQDGNQVFINADGAITINSNANIHIDSKANIYIDARSGGNINLKANGEVSIDAPTIELKGSYVGDPSSVGKGGFAMSSSGMCPFSGEPHVCSKIIKA